MKDFRARTALELGAIAAVITFMTILIRPGQGVEDPTRIHAGIECARCHVAVADLAESVTVPDPGSRCRTCHTQASLAVNSRLAFHLAADMVCTTCHTFHNPSRITALNSQFNNPFSASDREALCGSCHALGANRQNLSPGHRRAATLFHSDDERLVGLNASEACLLCHTDRSHPGKTSQSIDREAPVFQDHGHPFHIAVSPGSGVAGNRIRMTIDPRIPLFAGKLECQSCHDLTSTNPQRLIGNLTVTDLCQGCHQLDR